jgi:arylsulfatase A-like enzyme
MTPVRPLFPASRRAPASALLIPPVAGRAPLVVSSLLLLIALLSGGAFAAVSRPNLIWIMADDLGYGELGSYGQKVIKTPHLDRMAREGLRFTHFYAGATVCAPSRSVVMTGQHHGRTRVRGNAGAANPRVQALRPEDVTVARVLQEAGYATALMGKWGLGDVGPAESGLPWKHGFDVFFGYLNQRHAHNHFTDFIWRNEEKLTLPNKVTTVTPDGAGYATDPVLFVDDLVTDEALKFVSQHQNHPFFLYWNMVIPHANNERTRDLKNGAHVPDFGPYTKETWPDPDKGQAAMITRMDSYVGRMLDHLRLLGIAENTLVIFTSDNGPHNESNHDLSRFQPSGPFSGIKRSLKDGGIRVPCIAWWPGRVRAGTETKHVGYFGDWFATAAELAGARLPSGLDSISFVPTLLGRPRDQKQHEFLYWELHERGFHQAALHQGRWKGIRQSRLAAPLELYDLQNDIAEKNDVAARHPQIVARIEAYLKTARLESADWIPRDPPAPAAKR